MENVHPGQGREGVVQRSQGVFPVQSMGHTVQVLEITVVTIKTGFLDPGSSTGVTRSAPTAATRTKQASS